MPEKEVARTESRIEVNAYLQNLRYALNNGAAIDFQIKRKVDEERKERFTNRYTVATLFPDKDAADALREELLTLTVEEYMRTVKDLRFPNKSEMREFGRVYNGTEEVYIKIRVELLGEYGKAITFVMSFHFAEKPFEQETFPYRETKEEPNGNEDNR